MVAVESGKRAGEDLVMSKKPNPWGLHDMHGFLYQPCLDGYHFREPLFENGKTLVDPLCDLFERSIVIRGGSPHSFQFGAANDISCSGRAFEVMPFEGHGGLDFGIRLVISELHQGVLDAILEGKCYRSNPD